MSALDHPAKGDILAGKYQIEETLGAGGMGVVVAARHIALRQRFAVKFLLPQAMRFPDAVARFLREARAAVAIQSEHVARVHDVSTLDNGAPFMVMEHLTGTDLGRALKQRGALPVEEAIDFILQAGEAIAEAHALGIVHRDLKPANLFLTTRADGSSFVKVLDFGLSKMGAEEGAPPESSLTATNMVAGSPQYMSPEQVRSLKRVDWRADIWALGVILYESLTGRRPFDGPSLTAICASITADQPQPLRAHRAELPEALDAAVLRCLEKDPIQRMGSLPELAEALAPFAPARSHVSLERIAKLMPNGATVPIGPPAQRPPAEGMAPPEIPAGGAMVPGPEPAMRTSAPPAPGAVTTGRGTSWGRTGPVLRRSALPAILGGVAGAILMAMAVWTLRGSLLDPARASSSAPPPAPTATSPAASPATTPSAPASPSPPTAAPVPPAPAPPASAPRATTSARPTPPPTSAPAVKAAPKPTATPPDYGF
jgi:serine/threonine-protein kinase